MDRRTFIKGAAAAGMSFSSPAILGATRHRKYRTALIGSGWWGMNILNEAVESQRCEAVALCDPDENQLRPACDRVEKKTGVRPRTYKDFRELLEKEKPEIAIVGSPDHWHALHTIAAVKAGAHVYVEKPIGHTIREGRAMVKAARDADCVVQVGTHRRVSPHNMSGHKFLKSGEVGKIGLVQAFVHYHGDAGSPTPDSDPPRGLDWDLWCGPAPLRQFNKRIHPKGFRQFLDYANGQLGDWGIHWMDQILMWTDEKYPKTVYSAGGRFVKKDNTDAPDTQVAVFQFEGFTATWEHRLYAGTENEKGENVGVYFHGTKGIFHMGWRKGWTFYGRGGKVLSEPAQLNKPDDQNIRELWADFLDAIEKKHRPVCDIEIGHRSTNMALLGMLSLKLGRSIQWDGEKEMCVGDDEANALLARKYRAPWEYPKS